ncbi:MAG: redoxin protein [Candidatus Solibacter sp.]|nr:redoxin protein [Candidatus Solibacter sp.]
MNALLRTHRVARPAAANQAMKLLLTACLAIAAWGQPASMKGSPAARAEFAKGEAALRADDWDGAAAAYGKAVALDPEFFEAHQQYYFTSASGKNYDNLPKRKKFEASYLSWARQHPDKAVYRFILGLFYQYENPDLAARYFAESVKVDATFAPGWDALAFTAAGQGQLAESREYDRKAMEAWSESAHYAMLYVRSMSTGDFGKFRDAAIEYSTRFPDQAAGILQWVAARAPSLHQSQEIYEILRDKHLPAAAGKLEPLFQIYLREDAAKALNLARGILQHVPGNPQWISLARYAQAIARMADAGALAMLDTVTLPPETDRRMLEVARAKARDALGATRAAYVDLLKYFVASPSDEARAELLALGAKLSKRAAQIDGDVLALRRQASKPGIRFSTTRFTGGTPISLASQKGKVFLLSFWYPMCGPCRVEFPFLQAVLEKYRARGFEIVAVNGHPPEDAWVTPMMAGWRLDFITAHGTAEFLKAYAVHSFPSNFLYGADGRIYYLPRTVDTLDARRELELQIEALLP